VRTVAPSTQILYIPDGDTALALLERIGRVCYKSESSISDGRDAEGNKVNEPSSYTFLRKILKAEAKAALVLEAERKLSDADSCREELADSLVRTIYRYTKDNPPHESVIEHCSATVLFTCNRGVTHELVRHRLCSFTQESTRYVDYNKGKFGGDTTLIKREYWGKQIDAANIPVLQGIWERVANTCEEGYKQLRANGVPPEIARDLLVNATKADIVVTANFREWRHIFELRTSPAAHPDMRLLMEPLQQLFRKCIPIVFDDWF
jgi:thymidylate synthase (FAD)